MNINKLFETDGDDQAVSPVIGVILMVAITVILAAVIGAFVIGIGEDQEVQPTASFSFDFSSAVDVTDEEEDAEVIITHSQGDTISSLDSLFVVVGGDRSEWDNADGFEDPSESSDPRYEFKNDETGTYDVSAGDQVTIVKTDGDNTGEQDWEGESISIVWESKSGDSSSTLSDTTAPN